LSDRGLSVWSEYGPTQYAFKEWAAGSGLATAAFEFSARCCADWALLTRNRYLRAQYACNAIRLLEGKSVSRAVRRHHQAAIDDARSPSGAGGDSRLLSSFLGSQAASRYAELYSQHGRQFAAAMKFPKANDHPSRQGNLVVLKPFDPATGEKGVLYLQYTESIASFVALFDLEAVAREYRLVLEPSTWGYQDAAFLLLLRSGFDVVVQAQDAIDYEYIRALGSNLLPIRLGAGDWIDPDNFSAGAADKAFDFVMVASWSPVKRHTLFFASLAAAGLQHAAIALIGYPWEGRTRQDIERSAAQFGISNVRIFERIPRDQVAQIIRSSRVGVMLSRREGANRGVYECLFCDVPVVISKSNRGFNKDHINEATGRLAGDDNLGDVLAGVLSEHGKFSPRQWAEQNTGYRKASATLDRFLRELAHKRGEPYRRAIAVTRSAPAAVYVDEADRIALQAELDRLIDLLRPPARS
jgi:glycosyltransferase involved in cell wall biosynthesis